MPPNDEVVTLGKAIGPFIQWPKRDICLEQPAPVSTSWESPATVPSPQELSALELPTPELLAPMRQGSDASDASTPHAQSTAVKLTSKK